MRYILFVGRSLQEEWTYDSKYIQGLPGNSIVNREGICQGGFHPKDEIPHKLEAAYSSFFGLNTFK